jgi:hypothetical protein
MPGIGSVRCYDYERAETSLEVIQRNFLKGRNEVSSSSQKICVASSRVVLGGEAISLAMQNVHENNQNTENQEGSQQQPFT